MPFIHVAWLPKACRTPEIRKEVASARGEHHFVNLLLSIARDLSSQWWSPSLLRSNTSECTGARGSTRRPSSRLSRPWKALRSHLTRYAR